MVDHFGHLGTVTSSERFKEEIKPMREASEAILKLNPVTFRYKKELDADRIPQFGLVAEEVEKVDPDLVARDCGGKPYTVRYEAVNAMLLNEFLKEHRQVEKEAQENAKQGAEIAALRVSLAEMKATLEKQAEQIQKVSARITSENPSPRLVSTGEYF